jgi:transposase-like protein
LFFLIFIIYEKKQEKSIKRKDQNQMMGAGDESQTNKSELKKCCSICDRETELLFKKTIGADVKDHFMCHLCSPMFHQATQFLSNGFLCPSEVKFHIAVAWVLFDLDEAHQIKNAWEHFRSRVVSINPHISFTVHRDSTKKCAVCSTHKGRTVALEYTVDQGFICEDCAKIYDLLALSFTKSYLKARHGFHQSTIHWSLPRRSMVHIGYGAVFQKKEW